MDKYSKLYRVIHWTIAISFTLLLITIFLRMTWINKYNIADVIENYMGNKDANLSRDELIILAKQIRKPMWNWHIYLGYSLVGLISLRIILPLFGKIKFQNPLEKEISTKLKFKRWTYFVFYLCVIVSLITGLVIELGPKTVKKSMESIHKLSVYYLVPYLLIHLAGVLYAEFTDEKGIISRIISGPDKKD